MNHDRLFRRDFSYHLPDELVAQLPCDRREYSRLLEYQAGVIRHHRFHEISKILPADSLLVINDTRVIPGRILGRSPHGGRFELMLIRPSLGGAIQQNRWHAIGRPMKKMRVGQSLALPGGCVVKILAKVDSSSGTTMELEFSLSGNDFDKWLDLYGRIPLPPYIQRDSSEMESCDRDRYQTVYADAKGSVAAPTAGLHFTRDIMHNLEARGVEICPITLHVGAGTFLPVKADDPNHHSMHTERYFLSQNSYDRIIKAMAEGRSVIAVGTTSFRCLQSFHLASTKHELHQLLDRWLETDLFIYPRHRLDRFRPWAVNGLITNFHQPESTLLMLVSALLGFDEVRNLYEIAISERYRFFSYGDTSLLWLDRLIDHVDQGL